MSRRSAGASTKSLRSRSERSDSHHSVKRPSTRTSRAGATIAAPVRACDSGEYTGRRIGSPRRRSSRWETSRVVSMAAGSSSPITPRSSGAAAPRSSVYDSRSMTHPPMRSTRLRTIELFPAPVPPARPMITVKGPPSHAAWRELAVEIRWPELERDSLLQARDERARHGPDVGLRLAGEERAELRCGRVAEHRDPVHDGVAGLGGPAARGAHGLIARILRRVDHPAVDQAVGRCQEVDAATEEILDEPL